ncbi:MAG: hypothetical protein KZQ64_15255 [gamma proteobacterium symbiont of Bathyaustriella thionipta]|nr:hypothetical protein [gamma proteobacterium symbiont of Bathyaustriella thionipta]MCU7950605.1 hypothetical protein [gamma proteobacterium symbiont of Bathyaustriella thionipta]MCU7954727.1 hypothetical protein [gamma proteobacterium symbiont of Bathyaustriella thionipta]MCU7957113.1 hypothetical protein [gamma proteobacterium symbiont of Bathyaustriella thionipta]MCU7968997.1 hypothetical protein [gamma proteobacterium symbiont of Bathyaustriella thionipta]
MSENEKMEMSNDEIEIIDFQSEDRSDSQEKSNIQPVPTGIKLLLGGISLALLLGLGTLYLFKDTNQSIANDANRMDIDADSDNAVGTGCRSSCDI